MFSSINKTFGCCSKIFGYSNKKIFVVPNFVAVTKPFFHEVMVKLTNGKQHKRVKGRKSGKTTLKVTNGLWLVSLLHELEEVIEESNGTITKLGQ